MKVQAIELGLDIGIAVVFAIAAVFVRGPQRTVIYRRCVLSSLAAMLCLIAAVRYFGYFDWRENGWLSFYGRLIVALAAGILAARQFTYNRQNMSWVLLAIAAVGFALLALFA